VSRNCGSVVGFPLVRLTVELLQTFDLLWIRFVAYCTTCCTANPQEIDGKALDYCLVANFSFADFLACSVHFSALLMWHVAGYVSENRAHSTRIISFNHDRHL